MGSKSQKDVKKSKSSKIDGRTRKAQINRKKKNFTIKLEEILHKPEEYAPKGNQYTGIITETQHLNENKALLKAKIKSLLKKGRAQIETKAQLEEFPRGSLVSYMTKEGKYVPGGFLKTIKDEYFALQGGTTSHPISFPVKFKNIKFMWVGNPFKTVKDEVSLTTDKAETNFPVKLGEQTIYYAKNNFDRERFKETEKYKRMKAWYKKYGLADFPWKLPGEEEEEDEEIEESPQPKKKKGGKKKKVESDVEIIDSEDSDSDF